MAELLCCALETITTLLISYAAAKSLQSCPTLCDPIDGSPPGSPSLGFKAPEIHQLLKCAQRREKAGYCDGEKMAEEMQEAQEGERWKYKE